MDSMLKKYWWVFFLIAVAIVIYINQQEVEASRSATESSEKGESCKRISNEEFERLKGHRKQKIISDFLWWSAWTKDNFVRKYKAEAIADGTPNIAHDIAHYGAWKEAYGYLINEEGYCHPN